MVELQWCLWSIHGGVYVRVMMMIMVELWCVVCSYDGVYGRVMEVSIGQSYGSVNMVELWKHGSDNMVKLWKCQ